MFKARIKTIFLASLCWNVHAIELTTSGFFNSVGAFTSAKPVLREELMFGKTGSSASDFINRWHTPRWYGLSKDPGIGLETLVGLQLDGDITDEFSTVVQITADGSQNYDAVLQWLFGRYQYNENISFKVGRFRAPFLMISDHLQVGLIHPWVRPPAQLYNLVPITFSNLTGGMASFSYELWDNDLDVDVVYGSTSTNHPLTSGANNSQWDLRHQKGINIAYGNTDWKVKAAVMNMELSVRNLPSEVTAYNTFETVSDYTKLIIEKVKCSFVSLGFLVDYNNYYLSGEYGRRIINSWISDGVAGYLTAGYRFGNTLATVTYASVRTTDKYRLLSLTGGTIPVSNYVKNSLIKTMHKDEDSIGIDLKWTPKAFLAIKAGVHRLQPKNGTAGLFSESPRQSVYIYSLGLNYVF